MIRTDAIIIGAGQAGLAMSRCLSERGIGHVVLERGRVAERWRRERWDSLRLLTPNWMTRLPGFAYAGPDPDGFMRPAELVTMFEDYARSLSADVFCDVEVEHVTRRQGLYRVVTSQGGFAARALVVATGQCARPTVPAFAGGLPGAVRQMTPIEYRNPRDLAEGGVMMVGASATGLQLAHEIHRSGRPVTIAVGHHTRLPRRYRGADIMHWLDRAGVLDDRWDAVADVSAARRQPSLQLAGGRDHATIDLGTLALMGVRVLGRAVAAEHGTVHCAGDLARRVRSADEKLARLVARIDAHIATAGVEAGPKEPVAPLRLDGPPTAVHLAAEGISTVIWATGYRRDYHWLDIPILDETGEIVHDGGVTRAPGLYAIGLQFLRRRKSSFIDGVGPDAVELSDHLASHLARSARRAA